MKSNAIPNVIVMQLDQLARSLGGHPNKRRQIRATIQEAYTWATRLERERDHTLLKSFRCTNESLQVTRIAVTEMSLDLSAAIAAILTPPFLAGWIKQQEIEERFGMMAANILATLGVLQSCNLKPDTICRYPNDPNIHAPHMIAILLQICDIVRLHYNCAALENQGLPVPLSNAQLLFELKYFYIPLTHRMRLYDTQTKLADFWLKHADAFSYYAITHKLGMTKCQRQKQLELIAEEVEAVIRQHNIDFIIKKRIKSVYSIWRKIQSLKVNFNQIHDLAAIRIIVLGMDHKTPVEEKIICWKILSILSDLYKPMHTVMRDWISLPKENGYESLHLAFETHKYGQLEVQIRTERMDYIAEYGKAAHWRYKWYRGG